MYLITSVFQLQWQYNYSFSINTTHGLGVGAPDLYLGPTFLRAPGPPSLHF